MNLSTLQAIFLHNVALLILKMSESPYSVTGGELYRTKEQAAWNAEKGIGIIGSQHCRRLAIDLNLFVNGVYTANGEDYKPFGEFWKSINSLNRWGGDFKLRDYVHFEMRESQ